MQEAGAVSREGEARWRAVLAHDRRFDGAFVYAVRSTGIYCRPSCSSRRPKRPQVVFFSLPAAAEQAGFRPCRRCRPQATALRDAQKEMVERAARHIERNLDAPLSLKGLSAAVGGNLGLGLQIPIGEHGAIVLEGRGFYFPTRTVEWEPVIDRPLSTLELALLARLQENLPPLEFEPWWAQATVGFAIRF